MTSYGDPRGWPSAIATARSRILPSLQTSPTRTRHRHRCLARSARSAQGDSAAADPLIRHPFVRPDPTQRYVATDRKPAESRPVDLPRFASARCTRTSRTRALLSAHEPAPACVPAVSRLMSGVEAEVRDAKRRLAPRRPRRRLDATAARCAGQRESGSWGLVARDVETASDFVNAGWGGDGRQALRCGAAGV